MSQLRLDKFLADAGIGSRSQVKQYLKTGQITVNGTVIKTGNIKILPDTDLILYQGNPVVREPHVYYMLNKPAGYVSAVKDDRFPTVISLINDPSHPDLFPVGRLDKDTEGLLLITNDGALAHRLLSPKKHVDKTYYTEFRGNLPEDAATQFQQGIDIEIRSRPCRPCFRHFRNPALCSRSRKEDFIRSSGCFRLLTAK